MSSHDTLHIAAGTQGQLAPPGPDDLALAEGVELHQYLQFSLSSEMHAIRIDLVKEILEVVHMTPLPLMPSFLRGVMNLRGSVVPVIDLSARLDLGVSEIGRRTCVVIVDLVEQEGDRPQTMGVLVDAVHEVFAVPAAEIEPVPRLGTRIPGHFIKAMVRVRDRSTAELDLAAVLRQSTLSELIAHHNGAH